jgi:hypothetical protein
MSYAELQSSVKELSKIEKLGLIQFIVSELAKEEGINLIKDRDIYPIWSPYEAFEASDILYEALKKEKIIYE